MPTHHTYPATGLPIEDVLETVCEALSRATGAVLVAPPGAGKTTVVPLALLGQEWLRAQRILVLEPRRLAARAAAQRMSELLGEAVGQTVGVRARLDTKVGPETRIEVITEGVFTRMIIDDPALEGVGAVVFDEFHERSLDSDLGLALALDTQAGLRDDLRLLAMSATMDGAAVAEMLGGGGVIESDGRSFPVETIYLGRANGPHLETAVVGAILRALSEQTGSVLAFLPGQREVLRVRDLLESRLPCGNVLVAPLFGALEAKAQDRAIEPAAAGWRKVVLATAIAETSLTIEGVSAVVDAGLARVPRYDAGARMTRLETVRASRASVDQRRGRAGRLGPGVCYRLWSAPETQGLHRHDTPEIKVCDLTALVLDCAAWGETRPQRLTWLDPPSPGSLDAAREALLDLRAISADGRLTARGRALRQLPMPPHLAAMVVDAVACDQGQDAAALAAVLIERGLGGSSVDLEERLHRFRRDKGRRAGQMRQLARSWAKTARQLAPDRNRGARRRSVAGLLALAYPDRIGRRRGRDNRFLLAGGREARLAGDGALSHARMIVVGELQGRAAGGRIIAGAELADGEVEDIAAERIEVGDELKFDAAAAAVRAARIKRLGAIVLSRDAIEAPRDQASARELARGIVAETGLARLPWRSSHLQLIARISFLRRSGGALPDVSLDAIAADWEDRLVPFLIGKIAVSEIAACDLTPILDAILSWHQRQHIDAAAPTHFQAPTGNRFAIDYAADNAPVVAVRVQELFGLQSHPTVADGSLALTLELLSPANRPIQVTRDLPGFWAGSWRDVRAQMKGRYPKHVWPDDPAQAQPTTRAKPRR